MIKIIFESRKYHSAIREVQEQLRNKLKHGLLSEDENKILQWVSDLISDEMNERDLKHYWDPKE